jgi:hypothetical protein
MRRHVAVCHVHSVLILLRASVFVLFSAVSIRILAPRIVLASTVTSKDYSRRLFIRPKECISMLLCMLLYLTKGTINVRVNSFRWRSERLFSVVVVVVVVV